MVKSDLGSIQLLLRKFAVLSRIRWICSLKAVWEEKSVHPCLKNHSVCSMAISRVVHGLFSALASYKVLSEQIFIENKTGEERINGRILNQLYIGIVSCWSTGKRLGTEYTCSSKDRICDTFSFYLFLSERFEQLYCRAVPCSLDN